MTDYLVLSLLQDVLLVGCLSHRAVMDYKCDAVTVSHVRDHADVVFKHHYVAALPLLKLVYVGGEAYCVALKVYKLVSDPPEVYVVVYRLVLVALGICSAVKTY